LELFDSAIQGFKAALHADASKLSMVGRHTVQGELDNVEERAMRERTKVKDYYEILDLDRNCTTAEICKAYRAQSLKHHPDKFRLVQEAYNILSDPTKRWSYD
ncbi:DnaJ-domain-containing protein, partial [Daedalea quercina L-15889]